jgi:hypothetical protein
MITNFKIESEKLNGFEIIKIEYDEYQKGNYDKAMKKINEYKTEGFLIDFDHLCPITHIRTTILNNKKVIYNITDQDLIDDDSVEKIVKV